MVKQQMEFILGQRLTLDETRRIEFKEVRGGNPLASIINTADEYAVAFLNSEGGTIFWGIRDDDHEIVGVRLNSVERDELRRKVTEKLCSIQPQIDPTKFRVDLHKISGNDLDTGLFVIQLQVPDVSSSEPFYTASHEVFVRLDGSRRKLTGPQLTDWIRTRDKVMAKALSDGLNDISEAKLLDLVETIEVSTSPSPTEPSSIESDRGPLLIEILPSRKFVCNLALELKTSKLAYPLLSLAELTLENPERYWVVLKAIPNPPISGLVISRDGNGVWLSEEDAMRELRQFHLHTHFCLKRVEVIPPKGIYTFVAQCGMSGAILGPPNYHDYQNKLRKLHAERFSRMPFEAFKSRIKIVKDEATIKKWLDSASHKMRYYTRINELSGKEISEEEIVQNISIHELKKQTKRADGHTFSGVTVQQLISTEVRDLICQFIENRSLSRVSVGSILAAQLREEGLQSFRDKSQRIFFSGVRPRLTDVEKKKLTSTQKYIFFILKRNPTFDRHNLLSFLRNDSDNDIAVLETELNSLVDSGQVAERADGGFFTYEDYLETSESLSPTQRAT